MSTAFTPFTSLSPVYQSPFRLLISHFSQRRIFRDSRCLRTLQQASLQRFGCPYTLSFGLPHAHSLTMKLHTFAVLFFTLLLVSSASPHPHPTLARQISADVFTCDSSDALLNAVCQIGLKRINSELEAAGISVNRNGVLFTYNDDEDKRIKTGHSCTVTAQVRHLEKAPALISSSTRLDFSGNSIT